MAGHRFIEFTVPEVVMIKECIFDRISGIELKKTGSGNVPSDHIDQLRELLNRLGPIGYGMDGKVIFDVTSEKG